MAQTIRSGVDSAQHSTSQDRVRSEGNPKNWIHKARAEEVVDDMIEGMRKAMRVDALWWLEELRQPKRYISVLSGKGKDLTIDIQIETPKNIANITTTALVDSGCTSSAINRAFVKNTISRLMPLPHLFQSTMPMEHIIKEDQLPNTPKSYS